MSEHDIQTNLILERNLRALAAASGPTAALVLRARPRRDVEFVNTDDGVMTALLGDGPGARLLASRRRPLEEAARFAQSVPVESTGGVAVLGFGVGHHVAAVAERFERSGLVIVFEPDVELLRAVLERIDHSAWLSRGHVRVLTSAEDQGAIAAAMTGYEGVVALGARLADHPASRARLGGAGAAFSAGFMSVIKALRTNVVTTLVQMEATIRNLLMNLDHYSRRPGIAQLKGAAKGKPAVVVSAGPSLKRNIDLLARPGVRERVVIIAAQTVLKPLLARGIKPHLVTALDYHEISRRFYEGLTAEDVAGVTLVAEPKANPAILDAFPGEIRCASDPVLDVVLGDKLRREMGELRNGATVAHLAYYLARHLGCDPVMLIGQDLGFTDGQYYAAGAAIHQVWSGELNEFRTLEMMEWERIVRSRSILRKTTDTLGRPVYTDEQMATYLVQFERDFGADARAGLSTIDATEGGVAKNHTTVMTLAEALDRYAPDSAASADGLLCALTGGGAEVRPAGPTEADVIERVRTLRAEVWRIEELSRRSAQVLERMRARHGDQRAVNKLIEEVYALRDEAVSLRDAYWLVHHLNQTGTLKRYRADRSIELDETLPPLEQQRRQIERDEQNVRWLAESAAQMGRLLEDAAMALNGGAKTYRDPATTPAEDGANPAAGTSGLARGGGVGGDRGRAEPRVAAVMVVDTHTGGLGTVRDLAAPVGGCGNALRLTLERLARCEQVGRAVLLTDEPERVRALAGPAVGGLDVVVMPVDLGAWRARARVVGASRLFGPACWRGALGNLSVYDEAFDAGLFAAAMREANIDAGVIVGCDWPMVDPALIDQAVRRHLESPAAHRLTFTQAAPGLGACAVARSLVEELANSGAAGTFATLGGVLGYIPVAPQPDPVAKPACITVSPAVRDLGARCIADSAERRDRIADVLHQLGSRAAAVTADDFARAWMAIAEQSGHTDAGRHAVVELTTRRAGATRTQDTHVDLKLEDFRRVLPGLRGSREDAVLTLAGRGDPLLHPHWEEAIEIARDAGFAAVHVRTELTGAEDAQRLAATGVDVVSVDLWAAEPATYAQITGRDGLADATANVQRLISARAAVSNLPGLWVAPRITRCDLVYGEIESFYNRWLMQAGACVIDALPAAMPGQRIEPLPLPAAAARRLAREVVRMSAEGSIGAAGTDQGGGRRSGGPGSGVEPKAGVEPADVRAA